MKQVFFFLLIGFCFSITTMAQKIYSEDADYKSDKSIYFVDSDYKADLKIYFVDSDYKAKWRDVSKKHLLY